MIKINYPTDAVRLRAFNNEYYKKLSEAIGDYNLIDIVLAKVTTSSGAPLSLEKLLLAPFDELPDLNKKIKSLSPSDKLLIEKLKDYHDLRPAIASFFMAQDELKLSSCYYCNIDSIYSFSEFGDYRDPLDFIRRATAAQLELINQIGAATSKKILAKRALKQFDSIDECPVSSTVRTRILSFRYQSSHNHFTLDHFYHQAEYHYLRLCLYNFTPCCYACNSKFKKARKVYGSSALLSSPTSAAFSFHDDVSFKIYFALADHDVNSLDDFSVDLVAQNNPEEHAEFIRVLKLKGRYLHHKREALRLLKLKKEYPDSVVKELADTLGKPIEEMKRQLFGAELYDDDYDNSSLVKFKRDIARNIVLLDT